MEDFRVFVFCGSGETAVSAIQDAQDQANAWLEVHQWRTAEGTPAYVIKSDLAAVLLDSGPWYTFVLTFYGIARESKRQTAYTGKTERLG